MLCKYGFSITFSAVPKCSTRSASTKKVENSGIKSRTCDNGYMDCKVPAVGKADIQKPVALLKYPIILLSLLLFFKATW